MITIKGNKLRILNTESKNIKQILLDNRGILKEKEEEYFWPDYSLLHDPFLLKWVKEAVDRINTAIKKEERIVIFWDYDVDWVSSTAMLVKFLHEIWAKVSYRLPHRANDWYGLKCYFIDDIKKSDVKLLITVDCGTRDIDVINYAEKEGVDVIITDHHNIPDIIPNNLIALINPKLPDSNYPNKNLSWSWVAFKLLHAVASTIHSWEALNKILRKFIDFAMLWTIADCMSLKWENRDIAYLWLKQLKNSHSLWLKKLIEWENVNDINSDIVWFKIWPRLNAAWRMDTPYKALKVLLASESNLDEAISEIESLNEKRKISTEKFAREATSKVDSSKYVIFFDSPEIWHWVIGLIAWRLAEAHNKLAIVLKDEWDKLVWSARWPEYINIVEIFEEMKDLFEIFWGHNQAAWFTIRKSNFLIFKSKTEIAVSNLSKKIDTTKIITVDTIIDIKDIDFELIKYIESMRPFWIGNEKPVFMLKNVTFDKIFFIWKDNKHLKLSIEGSKLDFIAFWFWEYYRKLSEDKRFSVIFELEKNIWNSKTTINLNIKDIII